MAVSLNTALGAFPITALAGTAYVPLAGGTMTGALTVASGTLTASAPALNITQTWNQGATVFTALKLNVTNTASDSASLLQDWQVGGVSAAALSSNGTFTSSTGSVFAYAVRTSLAFYWEHGDLALYRDAAATLAQRNGTTQQIFRLYNNYTDPSNYERLTLTGVAGTSVNITAETLGTGGDNLDIVLSPAGTGSVKFPSGASVDSSGVVTGAAFVTASAGYFGGVVIGHPSSDAAFLRGAAGQIDVTNGTDANYRDLKLRNLIQTAYHEVAEMTAPSAPAANSVRIYAEDNGSGKTRLMALFATGAAQQIAIEP